jgi:hypothetical protein
MPLVGLFFVALDTKLIAKSLFALTKSIVENESEAVGECYRDE